MKWERHQNIPKALILILFLLVKEIQAPMQVFVIAVAELKKKCPSHSGLWAQGQPPPSSYTTLIQNQELEPGPSEALGVWSLNLNELNTTSANSAFGDLLSVLCFFLHLMTHPGHFPTTTVTDLLYPVAVLPLLCGCTVIYFTSPLLMNTWVNFLFSKQYIKPPCHFYYYYFLWLNSLKFLDQRENQKGCTLQS